MQLTHANGVIFGGSIGNTVTLEPGKLVALDAETGEILWTYPAPGPLAGGVSVVSGVGYVGIGTNVGFLALLGTRSSEYLAKSVLAFSPGH